MIQNLDENLEFFLNLVDNRNVSFFNRIMLNNTKNQPESENSWTNVPTDGFNFDQWAKAVKPQLIAALRGNFTTSSSRQQQQIWDKFE